MVVFCIIEISKCGGKMSIIDEFIEGAVLSLPDEGIEKPNELLDDDVE